MAGSVQVQHRKMGSCQSTQMTEFSGSASGIDCQFLVSGFGDLHDLEKSTMQSVPE